MGRLLLSKASSMAGTLSNELVYYDIKLFTGCYTDDNVYFNSPSDFMKHESDPARLKALRHIDIILAIGRDDSNFSNNESLSGILWGKNIWHALRIWDGWGHD